MMWPFKNKPNRFGEYPSCDHLNIALDSLLENSDINKLAITEICFAIGKANGYFYDHVKEKLKLHGFGNFVK